MSEIRKVARGWRWLRPSPLPASQPPPRMRTEASVETDWARRPWARTARDVFQELVMLPAMRYVARPVVEGRERLVDVAQPAVIAANHVSHFDTAVVIEALPRHWRHRLIIGAAADYFFSGPVRGAAAALFIGAFPVERKRASATSARLAVDLVQRGYSLILFPEGGRSTDGWLQELKPGAAFVAARTGRPLVPMWISGTEHLLPKGAKRPRRGRTMILIGDPLSAAPDEGPRELHARFEVAMRRLATEATTDWWTSRRAPDGDAYGPEAAAWRRSWARGEAPARPHSRWR